MASSLERDEPVFQVRMNMEPVPIPSIQPKLNDCSVLDCDDDESDDTPPAEETPLYSEDDEDFEVSDRHNLMITQFSPSTQH